MRANGVDLDAYPPVAISILIAQTARSLSNEIAVGVTQGHDELRAFVERQISMLKTAAPVFVEGTSAGQWSRSLRRGRLFSAELTNGIVPEQLLTTTID